ncbi:allophanate hydrolase subunit 1 [Candidatus Hecatella orcuttiae]|jgi:KipI family sensor histidine kinase inhibitor|uniref:5-oxoprolinase subunit B family protein n=1 Tax=Candidatus Hecatella orcuttiae TaxID=1935119 RepID=UPI00286802E7|nr:allophanate hydrolase subunit 1 [Candidatus Hecatella orcuttiae]
MVVYKKTAYRPLGEKSVLIEFGDEPSLLLNFRVVAFNLAIKESDIPGIVEVNPVIRSLAVIYDPKVISREKLVKELKKVESEMKELKELPSRLIKWPFWYDDPYTRECAKAHWDNWPHDYGGGCETNIEFLAKYNGMTVDELIKKHSGTDWWVVAVGFTPGFWTAAPLDPSVRIVGPKYKIPRTWTPPNAGAIGTAGIFFCMYSIRGAGGIPLIGISPWNTYEPEQKNRIFKDSPVFIKVGDRVRFIPIGEDEYREIRRKVEEGTCDYEANIKSETFNVKEYLEKYGGKI